MPAYSDAVPIRQGLAYERTSRGLFSPQRCYFYCGFGSRRPSITPTPSSNPHPDPTLTLALTLTRGLLGWCAVGSLCSKKLCQNTEATVVGAHLRRFVPTLADLREILAVPVYRSLCCDYDTCSMRYVLELHPAGYPPPTGTR